MIINILFGVLSILVVIFIGWLFCENKKDIRWRVVGTGLLIDFLLLIFFIKVPIGVDLLNWLTDGFIKIVSFGNVGIEFIFGKQLMSSSFGVFFVSSLMPVVYMCSLIYVLYKLKVIPFMIRILNATIGRFMGISGFDATATIGNTILGGSEAPSFVHPYLDKATKSEIFTLITVGFSSTALSILPAYAGLGIPMKFLIIINILSVFTGLIMAKLIVPETEKIDRNTKIAPMQEDTLMGAVTSGANVGFNIAVKISALIIGVLGLLALVNWILGFAHLSLPMIFGWIMLPITKMLHMPLQYQHMASNLVATKIYSNEFVAFINLGHFIKALPQKVALEIVCLLLNFGNISVVGITVAYMKGFTDNKRVNDITTKTVWKSLLAGILSSILLTAIIAVVFA